MATFTRSVEVNSWAHGWGSYNTVKAVVDDDADGQSDGVENGDGSGYVANGNPLAKAAQDANSGNLRTVRVEAGVTNIGKLTWPRRVRPTILFGAQSDDPFWTVEGQASFVDFNGESVGLQEGEHYGSLWSVGMRLRPHSTNQAVFISDAGSPDNESLAHGVVLRDVTFVDCDTYDGWDANTNTGFKGAQRLTRLYRCGNVLMLGGRIQGVRQEHARYDAQLRGVYRILNLETFHCGRTASQIVARNGEADGRPGFGRYLAEGLRARDMGLQSGGGGYTFALKGGTRGDAVIRRCYVTNGCTPGLSSETFGTSGSTPINNNIVGAAEFNLSKGYNRHRYNWDSVLIDECCFVVGTIFPGEGSAPRECLKLDCGGRIMDVRRTTIHEYRLEDGIPRRNRPAIVFGFHDVFGVFGRGEKKTDLFRFDRRNNVIGSIRRVIKGSYELKRDKDDDAFDEWEWTNRVEVWATYEDFLAPWIPNEDPYNSTDQGGIDGRPGFEVYDSSEDGGDGSERLRLPYLEGTTEMVPAGAALKFSSIGSTIRRLVISAVGNMDVTPEPLNQDYSLVIDTGTFEARGYEPQVTISEDGGSDIIHTIYLRPNKPLLYLSPDEDVEDLRRTFIIRPPTAEMRLDPEQEYVFARQDGEDADVPAPRPEDLSNPLLGFFPPGDLSDRCETTSIKWRTTKALDTILREVEEWVRQWTENEITPARANYLLPEWLEMVGIPENCLAEYATTVERQRALAAGIHAMHGDNGLSEAKFLAAMRLFGFAVTITYPRVDMPHLDDFAMGDSLASPGWNFVFNVNVPGDLANIEFLHMGSSIGSPLVSIGNDALECLVDRFKPAHTLAVVVYGDCGWNPLETWTALDPWEEC